MSFSTSKSTAFSQISPTKTRLTGYEYFAFPVDNRGATPDPTPVVEASCVSQSGTYTLCGFPEFNGQESLPPKKYLRLSSSGNTTICYRTGASCVSAYFTRDSYLFDADDVVYDPSTCTANTVPLFHWVVADSSCGFQQTAPALAAGNVTQRTALSQDGASIVITPTTYTRTGLGTCISVGPNYSTLDGVTQQTLSDEDTDDDAIARASTVAGTECIASKATRGAGVFSAVFVDVTVTILSQNLVSGNSYTVTADLVTEDYGGGGEVITPVEWTFEASSSSNVIEYDIPCASGKTAQLQNIAIVQN